jgi:site-specific DNA-methyltransferase (adenine-specific)
MPALTWTTKSLAFPASVPLHTDSIIFPKGQGYPEAAPSNHLILGDNLAVMASLLPEYDGRIDLIYADPPFFTNRHYRARVGRGEDSRKPQEWQMAEGYPDHWGDLEAYLDMLYPRLALMHRLLSPTGTLYLHLDWHADAYARLLLDEIFGADRLLNEIIWVYHGPSPIRTAFNRKHDTILVYTKSENYTFNVDAVRQPYDPVTVKTFASSPKAGFGKIPNLERGKVPEDWWYFPVVARLHNERTGYPTQKPEALLERITRASSNPGELVADFFCGSGTAAVVAAQTGRRFIAVDGTWRAVHTTYTRLVEAEALPFTLQVEARSARIPESTGKPFSIQREGEINIEQNLLSDLDYWEIDPAWDGQVFRSADQATRPHKKGQIRSHISLQPEQVKPAALARLVKIDGSRTLHHLLR